MGGSVYMFFKTKRGLDMILITHEDLVHFPLQFMSAPKDMSPSLLKIIFGNMSAMNDVKINCSKTGTYQNIKILLFRRFFICYRNTFIVNKELICQFLIHLTWRK